MLYSNFANKLANQLNYYNLPFAVLQETNDIWLRDFMPVQVGVNQFVQFSLTKEYYHPKDRHKQTDPAPICKSLGIDPYIPKYNNKPIYLDGGNVIRGHNMAIITRKVLADNDIPEDELIKILREVLQVEKIILIPKETGDDTGHSDGMVRIFDERTVLANDYSNADVSQSFKDRFYRTLKRSGVEVLLIPYRPVYERIDGYWSASGCYINYLQVGEKIFLPTFEDPVNDEMAIHRFGEIFGQENIIPVQSNEIAKGGGILNCLSWEMVP